MKRRFLILPALCMGLLFSSCDNDRRTAQGEGYEQTEEGYGDGTEYGVETERTSAPGNMGEDDRQEFVEETASISRLEVEMAQLAEQKAQNEDVRNFAQRMQNDHSEANDRLSNIAQQQENIQMSQTMEDAHRDELDELRDKEGSEFDEAYLDKTIDNHEELIDKFENMRDNGGDAQNQEMSNWIDNRLNTLREHRDEAERIKERISDNNGGILDNVGSN